LNGLKYYEHEFKEKVKSTQKSKETKMNNPVVDADGNKCWCNEKEFHGGLFKTARESSENARTWFNKKLKRKIECKEEQGHSSFETDDVDIVHSEFLDDSLKQLKSNGYVISKNGSVVCISWKQK
jgi:hypothetical protein